MYDARVYTAIADPQTSEYGVIMFNSMKKVAPGTKAIIVLSGGQDSTTCLYLARTLGYELHAITFDYGQRHALEIQSAAFIAGMAGVEAYNYEVIKLGPVLKGTSPLVSGSELEQYADHKSLPGGIEKTFVPMRNQLFLTIAANRAVCVGATAIFTGVCEEDFGGYPDCRRIFIDALQLATNFSNEGAAEPIEIVTPLMNMTKAQTVDLALNLTGCYRALSYSHTSYDGQYPPTGHDHATLLRAKGFEEANVPDPLVLRAWREGLMELPETPNYSFELAMHYSEYLD